VHAAARIGFAAHGGQVVASAAVHAAVAGELDPGVRVTPLGTWRFQGIPEPLELVQYGAPGLPARFPELRSGVRVT